MGGAESEPIRVSLVTGAHPDTLAPSLAASEDRLAVSETDPTAAVDAAVEGATDCIVTGQAIPGTTGVDLVRSIRHHRSDLPVVFYPAAVEPAVASRAVDADVTEFLPGGPDGVSAAQLADRIADAVSAYRRDRDRLENEKRYRTMLDTVGDLVYALDPDGRFTFINETGAHVTGHDRSDLCGAHVSRVLAESDIEAGRDLIASLWTDGDRQRGTVEMTLETAAGERVPCENHIALLPPRDGQFVGTVGVMRDISERKRREEALEALHDATREMMAAERAEAVAAVASRTATEVLDMPLNCVLLYDEDTGVLRSAALSDRADDLFGSPIEFEHGEGIVWTAYENGETKVFSDVRASPEAYNPDTAARSEFVLPLGDHGAMLVGSRTVGDFDESDVALAKVLAANLQTALTATNREVALRDRERELERQNERLEEFASVVSHDLRNPLSVAQGRLELFAETGEQAHYEKIEGAHERMGEIIDEVLALAREGRTVRELEPVDVSALATDAWSNVATDGATLVASAAPVVQGDASRLQQLLENLFRNAVEHGSTSPDSQARRDAVEHGSTGNQPAADDAVGHGSTGNRTPFDSGDGHGPTVRVGTLDDGDGFYVADDGPGIPPDDRETIFESGFSTTESGSGFGLSIVSQIATAHGWDVTVTESPTGGARFEIGGVQLA